MHWCKVYRRIRWWDRTTKLRKYKDWKVKVIRIHQDERFSMDYLVVHKLPCTLDEIEAKLQQELVVHHSQHLEPRPICGLTWNLVRFNGKKTVVHSQMRFDAPKFYRFNFGKAQKMHLNQTPNSDIINPHLEDETRRVPAKQQYYDGSQSVMQLDKAHFPFYEVFIQLVDPKDPYLRHPIMYMTKESEAYSRKKNKKKFTKDELMESWTADVEYSSTDSEDDPRRFEKYEDFAWDEKELVKIQLDEHTKSRSFRRITLQASNNREDLLCTHYEAAVGTWPDFT